MVDIDNNKKSHNDSMTTGRKVNVGLEPPLPTFKFIESHINKNEKGKKMLGKYLIFKQTLGRGTFAHVKLCQDLDAKEYYAVKIYHIWSLFRKREFHSRGYGSIRITTALDKVYKEIELMQSMKGVEAESRCIKLHDVFIADKLQVVDYLPLGSIMIPYHDSNDSSQLLGGSPTIDSEFRPPRYVSLLWDGKNRTESCPNKPFYPELLAKCFICDAAVALQYLHSKDVAIAHRDIKPDNLFLGRNGRVKLGDFGVAGKLDEDGRVKGTEGTYLFLPPECTTAHENDILEYKGHDGRAADIWALGITMWCLLFSQVPFYSSSMETLFDSISKAKVTYPNECNEDFSIECRTFLDHLLEKNPLKRSTIEEVLKHPWLTNVDYQVAEDFAITVMNYRHENSK